MDELTIEGKIYISSKRAAALTGYAKDYVGQLCREGRVEARLVGRSWYISEPSILAHRFPETEEGSVDGVPAGDAVVQSVEEVAVEESVVVEEEQTSDISSNEAVFKAASYEAEELVELPELMEPAHPAQVKDPETPEEVLDEMQSSWQTWFKNGPEERQVSVEVAEVAGPSPKKMEAGPVETSEKKVPLHIISDIRPAARPQQPSMREPEGVILRERKVAAWRSHKLSTGNTLVIRALLVAVILLSITIAVIGTGITERISGTNQENFGVFDFLGGASLVK